MFFIFKNIEKYDPKCLSDVKLLLHSDFLLKEEQFYTDIEKKIQISI